MPTLAGIVSLTIPAGTRSGTRLRLKGKGLPASPAGDQIVVVQIMVPETLDESGIAALRDLEAAWGFNPRSHFASASTQEPKSAT